jgi:hypothetical protein
LEVSVGAGEVELEEPGPDPVVVVEDPVAPDPESVLDPEPDPEVEPDVESPLEPVVQAVAQTEEESVKVTLTGVQTAFGLNDRQKLSPILCGLAGPVKVKSETVKTGGVLSFPVIWEKT